MRLLEFVAVILGIASVWYARKEDIKVFPLGILSVLLFIYIFFRGKMYANAGINTVYLLTNIYGWYNWSRQSGGGDTLKITRNTFAQNMWLALFAIVFYCLVLVFLRWYNRSDTEYIASSKSWMDALNSSIFMCATVLMSLKKLENWHFWLLGNVISIPIFLSQGYYFTAFQYAVFFGLAVSGLKEWRKKTIDNT